eukprot:5990329-Amphidinium_carterae.1
MFCPSLDQRLEERARQGQQPNVIETLSQSKFMCDCITLRLLEPLCSHMQSGFVSGGEVTQVAERLAKQWECDEGNCEAAARLICKSVGKCADSRPSFTTLGSALQRLQESIERRRLPNPKM